MRTHTNNFKQEIAKNGRQINGRIFKYSLNYHLITENNKNIITEDNIKLITNQLDSSNRAMIDEENIYSMNIIKNGQLLQSLMKEFNFEVKDELEVGEIVNPQFAVLVDEDYEYLDYGNYIIYSKEYNADNQTWRYVAYDFMLKSMVQYETLNISYPCTIKEYIQAIADRLKLNFANVNDTFVNYDQLVLTELFENQNYTYRDILDKLSEIVAGNILINDNNELEIKYVNETNDVIDEEYLRDINVNFGEIFGPINKVAITETDGGYEYPAEDSSSIETNGLTQINIIDNEFAFNGDSETIVSNILDQIKGLTYSINDFATTGVCYYDFLDLFEVSIEGNTYPCLLLNNEIVIEQGLTENIFTNKLENSEKETDNFKTSIMNSKEVSFKINQQEGKIESKVEKDGVISAINQSAEQIQIDADKISLNGKEINMTSDNILISSTNFNVDQQGNCTANSFSSNNATITGGSLNITGRGGATLITLTDSRNNTTTTMKGSNILMGAVASGTQLETNIDTGEIDLTVGSYRNEVAGAVINMEYGSSYTRITATGGVDHSSREEYKKSIKEHNNNLNLIKNAKIYEFLYKEEDEKNKKHIGLIIGEKYNTPKEVISNDENGINLTNMCGIMWGAIKEQQEQIETLQAKIEKLEKEVK